MAACLEVRFRFHEVELHGLRVLGGDRVETWLLLPAQPVVIGRATGAHIRVPNESTLSRRHAEIQPGFTIRDLTSSSGTYVNQDRVLANSPPRPLASGDVIYLGAPSSSATATFHAEIPMYTCTAAERGLLSTGSIYADWLEDRGDLTRAAFVRDREKLSTMKPGRELDALVQHCLDTIDTVDAGWRFAVVRSTQFQKP